MKLIFGISIRAKKSGGFSQFTGQNMSHEECDITSGWPNKSNNNYTIYLMPINLEMINNKLHILIEWLLSIMKFCN